jgi:hypothetical protein
MSSRIMSLANEFERRTGKTAWDGSTPPNPHDAPPHSVAPQSGAHSTLKWSIVIVLGLWLSVVAWLGSRRARSRRRRWPRCP